jgi:hypothetical protein
LPPARHQSCCCQQYKLRPPPPPSLRYRRGAAQTLSPATGSAARRNLGTSSQKRNYGRIAGSAGRVVRTGLGPLRSPCDTLAQLLVPHQHNNQIQGAKSMSRTREFQSSASPEISHILRNPKVRCRIHNSPPRVSALIHMNPVNTLAPSLVF